ncbi:MAG: hypothetical protein ACI32N_10495 [Bulleidia sp.]
MFKKISQHTETVISIIGNLIIPIALWVTYFIADFDEYNYTGAINRPDIGIFMKCAGLILWAWVNVLLYRCTVLKKKNAQLFILDVLALCTMFIPYHNEADLTANLHVVFGLLTLVWFNLMIVQNGMRDFRLLRLYVMLCIPAFVFVLRAMSIDGLSEIIYTWGVVVYLTYLCTHQKKKG